MPVSKSMFFEDLSVRPKIVVAVICTYFKCYFAHLTLKTQLPSQEKVAGFLNYLIQKKQQILALCKAFNYRIGHRMVRDLLYKDHKMKAHQYRAEDHAEIQHSG
jgi:hypothetical protein